MCSPFVNAKNPINTRAQYAKPCTVLAIVSIILAALSPWAVAGGIYKSIDSQGNVVFTDQPSEDAEPINSEAIRQQHARHSESNDEQSQFEDDDDDEGDDDDNEYENANLPSQLLVAPEPVKPPKHTATETEEPANHLPIARVEILTPEQNTSVHDPLGQIWVEVQSYPTSISRSGLTAQLWMDGNLVTSDRSTVLKLPPPAHGTHVLQVKLVDKKGRLFHQSRAINIHVKYRSAKQ